MKKYHFGLIGFPVGHTMSPFIHAALFRLAGIDADYTVFSVSPQQLSLPQTKETLLRLNGFNVTIPHKQAVMALLQKTDPKAAAFSSVNTVKNENGSLHGFTTDGEGFLAALKTGGVRPGGKALVLGSGGVSRVMAFELADAAYFPDLVLCVRESGLSSARELADTLTKKLTAEKKLFSLRVCRYEELDPAEHFDLAVNGTPAGMYPNADSIPPLPAELYKKIGAAFDAVYNPQDTRFLQAARQAGAAAIGGMDMLVWQAAAAQRIWYGADFDPRRVAQISQSAETEMNRLFGGAKGD